MLVFYILVVDCHIKDQFDLTHDDTIIDSIPYGHLGYTIYDTMHLDMYLSIELHMCYRIQYLKLVLLKIAFINVNKVRQ